MDTLELVVDEGRPADASRFFQLGNDLLGLLDEISDVPIAWRVEDLRVGSAVVRLSAPEDSPDAARWLGVAVESLEGIDSGGAAPDEWSPETVRAAHRLVEHGLDPEDAAGEWVAPKLVLLQGGLTRQVALTGQLAANLETLQPFERRMPGSVRGFLVGMNISRGNRASLRSPSGRIVRVGFDSALRADLKEALLQEVELQGEIRQDDQGRPFHIRAEGVHALVRPEVRWSDLFGIDPNFTGGADVDEFLEANRGEA